MVQIYGRRGCSETRKAERFFSERRVPVQSVDVNRKPPSARELQLFIQVIGADALIDRECSAYRDRGLAYMEFDAASELSSDPRLMRTPVVRSGRLAAVGHDPSFWAAIARSSAPQAGR